MSDGLSDYWRTRKQESKDAKLVNRTIWLISFLRKLGLIKKDHYVAYYGKVSWELACRDYVGRNWPTK
jgi:hypothetical protein